MRSVRTSGGSGDDRRFHYHHSRRRYSAGPARTANPSFAVFAVLPCLGFHLIAVVGTLVLRCFSARSFAFLRNGRVSLLATDITMTQAFARFNAVPHSLLEYLRFWETTLRFAIPEQGFLDVGIATFSNRLVSEMDLEETAGGRYQSDFADASPEGREEFLAEVGRPKHPSALGTVCDGYPGQIHRPVGGLHGSFRHNNDCVFSLVRVQSSLLI